MGKAKSTSAAKGVKIKKERSPTAGGGDGLSRSRLIAAATAQEEAKRPNSEGSSNQSAVHPSWQPWLKSVLAGAQAEITDVQSVHANTALEISTEVASIADDEVQSHLGGWVQRIESLDERLHGAQDLVKETETGLSLVDKVQQLQEARRKASAELSRAQKRHAEAARAAQAAAEELASILSNVRDHASPEILTKGKQQLSRSPLGRQRSGGGGGGSFGGSFGGGGLAGTSRLLRLQHQAAPQTACESLQQGLVHALTSVLRCTATIFGEDESVTRQALLERHDAVTLDHSTRWTHSFMDMDPRRQIMHFFHPGDERGPLGHLRAMNMLPARGKPSSYFTVFRPTSMDALRMMMQGRATGKGLNVKGKSAKGGELSGFVPFLQISKDEHKPMVGTSPKDARIRIYFSSDASRKTALEALVKVRGEMLQVSRQAEADLPNLESMDDDGREATLKALLWCMTDDRVGLVNQFAPDAFGLDCPERLAWEAIVTRQSIVPEPEWRSGRPSEPAFMELNLHATREEGEPGVRPKAVLWQHDARRPLNPCGLLLAYEEETVKPVVSDIDGFLIGSKGMRFEPTSSEQVQMISWCIDNIESLLETPAAEPWTKRWLGVLKKAADKGFDPRVPPYGFGDPTTYAIFQSVVNKLFVSGAVRHGAECSNYYFPQELDEEFLIVWEGFGRVPWRYVGQQELRSFLLARIADGFAFPLNPKWILCDEGWLDIFEALLASPSASQAMEAWFPKASGLRERIRAIAAAFPEGFRLPEGVADIDQDMAEYELRRYQMLRRAKIKLRAINRLRSLGRHIKPTEGATQEQMGVASRGIKGSSPPSHGGQHDPRAGPSTVSSSPPSAGMPAPADLPPAQTPMPSGGVLRRINFGTRSTKKGRASKQRTVLGSAKS